MTNVLTDTLNRLKTNPTLVIELYEQIFNAKFFTVVRKGSEEYPFGDMQLAIYNAPDGVNEFFLFTEEKLVPAILLEQNSIIKVFGQSFWSKIYLMMVKAKFQVTINPIGVNGIRLTKEMILGMIGQYGTIETAFNDLTGFELPAETK
jgi:hypothetical protein